MMFLLITLPWRFFYIKHALILMREHKKNRIEFLNLMRKLAKDYLCIFLYIVLLCSGVKTKRVLVLIKRNIKLNFYVGYLKYSHLKELSAELREAGNFYKSFLIILMSAIYAPYRGKQIFKICVGFYKKYREGEKERKKLQAIHDNTVK